MESILAIFIPIVAIIVSGGALIYALWAQNRERMAMIEKGMDVTSIYKKRSNPTAVAKWGFLLVGVALGLIIGALLIHFTALSEPAVMFSSIFLFGGLGLLIYYFTIGKKNGKTE
ncbi:hypothetical protein CYCD_07590 [Tenuifilaceae bacterium CYCD]|nr:hypothetical protein CYCD_07590 [Tenuifilaceae bacterium CYCD]